MRLFLISDNVDTYSGLRLAGIEGVVVHKKNHFKRELDLAIANKDIGIIIITERFSNEFSDIVNEAKDNHKLPLIIEIPDRHGTSRSADYITSYINEAIGLKL